mmetsp:Transcript_11462/g.33287  ORF Transcript_11462/g.33287 Transcript_11462/m.33287 type:complete len:160 (-) Transcript_11462:556-1035(-)
MNALGCLFCLRVAPSVRLSVWLVSCAPVCGVVCRLTSRGRVSISCVGQAKRERETERERQTENVCVCMCAVIDRRRVQTGEELPSIHPSTRGPASKKTVSNRARATQPFVRSFSHSLKQSLNLLPQTPTHTHTAVNITAASQPAIPHSPSLSPSQPEGE